MNYKLFFIFIFIFLNSCVDTTNVKFSKNRIITDKFSNKGFALIYDEDLLKKKIINKRINDRDLIIFQKNLNLGTSVKILNPSNNKSIIAKVGKNSIYPSFIGSWYLENPNLCKQLINFFDSSSSKQIQGFSERGADLNKKKRIDIKIYPNDLKNEKNLLLKNYIKELHNCYLDYLTQWPFLKGVAKEVHIGPFNMGKYEIGDHFGITHSERTSQSTLHRLFAFMTYLNNVESGGETYFNQTRTS